MIFKKKNYYSIMAPKIDPLASFSFFPSLGRYPHCFEKHKGYFFVVSISREIQMDLLHFKKAHLANADFTRVKERPLIIIIT